MPGPQKTKQNPRVDYVALGRDFERWWLGKLDRHFNFSLDKSIPLELVKEAECSGPREFEERFIKPLIALKPETITKILHVISKFYYHHSRTPVIFEATYSYQKRFEALFFILAQVKKLQLLPFEDLKEIGILFREPIKQCLWCGQIDKDPNGKPFNGSRRCCDASTEGSIKPSQKSPEAREGCAGQWKYFSDQIKQQVDRDAINTEEAWEYLGKACKNLLIHNEQTLKYSMRYIDSENDQLVAAYRFDSLLSPAEAEQEVLQMIKEGL